MKSSPTFTLILLLAVLCIAAIPAQAEALANTTVSFERTVTDDSGATVTIHGEPQRIVSLAPANTEILFALGLGDKVVGVTDYCNYPPEAKTKTSIGGYSTVSVEKVIAQKPDLIVASYGNGADAVNQLDALNRTVITLNPTNVTGVLDDIAMIGYATGTEDNAMALVTSLRARIDVVEHNASAMTDHPKVAHVVWNDPLYVSGNGTFQDELITMAGGTNAFADKPVLGNRKCRGVCRGRPGYPDRQFRYGNGRQRGRNSTCLGKRYPVCQCCRYQKSPCLRDRFGHGSTGADHGLLTPLRSLHQTSAMQKGPGQGPQQQHRNPRALESSPPLVHVQP